MGPHKAQVEVRVNNVYSAVQHDRLEPINFQHHRYTSITHNRENFYTERTTENDPFCNVLLIINMMPESEWL